MSEIERRDRALALYSEASLCEREGRLGDALAKYRIATKLEPNIDRLARSLLPQMQQHMDAHITARTSHPDTDPDLHIESQNYYSFGSPDAAATASDAQLAANLASMSILHENSTSDHRFTPHDPSRPVVIAVLPSELITNIIRWSLVLDFSLLPEIASTCRYLQHQTLSSSLWRWLCQKHHERLSYTTNTLAISTQLAQQYRNCWLTLWLEKPRPSFSGIYISRVNYIRQGYAESYYNPYLMVTYFRYLRLFRDGSMLLWTTSVEPSQALKELNGIMDHPANSESLDAAIGEVMRVGGKGRAAREKAAAVKALKGLLFGRWKMVDDVLFMDAIDGTNQFHYQLAFTSTKRGGHNKLVWIDFYHFKVSRDATEKTEIKTQRKPFVFSKVKSWKRGCF
ncbi:hypothetical protein HDU98_004119 [Podochytrium sp. JEL0797]|nr:hypothetical protein HDU98_004119 [Podochytrium sp. JEL0797]